MPYRKINIWKSIDWITVVLYLILVLYGWTAIYGASYDYDYVGMLDLSGRSGQQMVWIIFSLGLGFVILLLDSDWTEVFAYWIYIFMILLLILTIFLAPEIKGSRSWLVIGSLRIQPAEFAKFATALALAKYMSTYKFELMRLKNFLKVLMFIFLPVAFILLQKETGSALVFLSFFLMLYREGMPGTFLFVGFCLVLFFIISIKFSETILFGTVMGEFIVLCLILLIVFWLIYKYRKDNITIKTVLIGFGGIVFLAALIWQFYHFDFSYVLLSILVLISFYLLWLAKKYWSGKYLIIISFIVLSVSFLYSVDYVFDEILEPHQRVRIQVVLGTKDDPSGAGYNVNQSKIAIGSGGLNGKGFLNGTQTKLKYVPEQDTDFIFCTVGEEQGFIGSAAVLLLFGFLILRLIIMSERQKNRFNRIYGYCVASIIFFHLAVNIGMVIGLTPVIGIPLPFFSYGGSSLCAFTILLFVFLRQDASRSESF